VAAITAGAVVLDRSLKEAHTKMITDGYIMLKPGQTHTSEMKSLSLAQQVNIIRWVENDSQVEIRHGHLNVFTGATDKSNNSYKVSECTFVLDIVKK
jgi:hypothetical protein